jgi:hypothetical protein
MQKLLLLLKRFPITLLLVIGFAVLLFMAINSDVEIPYRLALFFSIGAFLSASAMLFAEDFFEKIKSYGITVFIVLLWGVYCIFLPENDDNIQITRGIEIGVIGTSAFLAMFFISFLKKQKDREFWNFSIQTLFQMVLACFFGAIIFGGLSLAVLAINTLFGIEISGKVYGNLAVACFVLFAPIYFLTNVPDRDNKHSNSELQYDKMQKIFALYILTPILAIYAVILYVYLFTIIVDWQLPRGWVSWLVSILALGGLLVTMLLYPVREAGKSKLATFLGRWLGVLILPLLVLMTIGIFRRIGDHGITINRCYILLLNLWFYGIYIYLFFTRSRRIKWILISPVIIALIASTGSWSVANITQKTLTREISNHLNNRQVSFDEAKVIFAEMNEIDRNRARGTLEYLHRTFTYMAVQQLFTDSVPNMTWEFINKDLGLTSQDNFWFDYSKGFDWQAWQVPEGYNAFMRISAFHIRNGRTESNHHIENEAIEITVPAQNRTISFSMREIVLEHLTLSETESNEREWIIRGDDYAILIRQFRGYLDENDRIQLIDFSGYLFFNR